MSNETKSFINNLTEGKVAKKLLLFAFPFMLSNLLQTVYNLVDMSVVGHYMGSAGLSAVSVGGRLVELLTMLCTGFCTGGQILLSQQVGARQKEDMQKTIGTLFTFILLCAVGLGGLSIIFHRPILTIMNTPAAAYEEAAKYMVICNSGCIFIFGYNALCAVLRGMGDSKRPLIFVAIASVVNLVLDLLFVAVFHMGAAGAAIATVFSQALSFLFAFVYLLRHRDAFGFSFSRQVITPPWQNFGYFSEAWIAFGLSICRNQCLHALREFFYKRLWRGRFRRIWRRYQTTKHSFYYYAGDEYGKLLHGWTEYGSRQTGTGEKSRSYLFYSKRLCLWYIYCRLSANSQNYFLSVYNRPVGIGYGPNISSDLLYRLCCLYF